MFMSDKLWCFVGGVVFGTVGIKILSTKDAKKVYVKLAAAGLRGKEYMMDTIANVQEVANDILAEAKEVNEERKRQEEEIIIDDIDVDAV